MKNILDSGTVLDYALFQLTPTRTRCDLVIYAGKKSEKIASGLLDPFLSNLKSAKDQIGRGGYSITLRLSSSSDSSSWFTKATLQRFVRFVSTPEILERFVSIEKEIGQMEKEIDSNGLTNGTAELHGTDGDSRTPTAASKPRTAESNNGDEVEAEEKPKVRLQRVLKSRKAILEKELAMVYARALVAGFEMDYLQDLVSFSDAFGAQRLREACMNFMEICNKKNDDKIWMDEVAAVQASYIGSPGIMASFENTDLSHNAATTKVSPPEGFPDAGDGTETASSVEFQHTEGASQLPPWRNSFPQYMQGAAGPYPMFQQMQPYPGFMFPGFQAPPSHYQPNMAWSGSLHNHGSHSDRETRKKDRNGGHVESESSDEQDDVEMEVQSRKKKPSKRSQGKVVIRNINYIAGGRNEVKSSDSEGYSSEDSIKQHVEAAVGSFKRHHKPKGRKGGEKPRDQSEVEDVEPPHSEEEKKDGNWDVFQDLLMKDSESRTESKLLQTVHVQEEYGGVEILKKKQGQQFAGDDFLFSERATGNRAEGSDVRFEGGEVVRSVVKRRNGEELLFPDRAERGNRLQNTLLGPESTLIRPQAEEDWITGGKLQSSRAGSIDPSIYHGDEASGNHFQTRDGDKDPILDDSFMVRSQEPKQTHPKADIFMDPNMVGGFMPENSVPEDLQVKAEATKFSEPDDLYMIIRHSSAVEQAAASWTPEMDGTIVQKKAQSTDAGSAEKAVKRVAGKDPKSKTPTGRSKSAVPARSRVPVSATATNRSRINSEEERRRRMEELLIQRQKRIAERSSAKGGTPKETTKSSSSSPKTGKAKLQAESKTLRTVTRSATMDRLAAPRIINNQPVAEARAVLTKKPTPKGNSTPTPKGNSTPTPQKKTKGALEQQNKLNPKAKTEESGESKNGVEDSVTVKDLHTVTSVEKKEPKAIPAAVVDGSADGVKSSIQVLSDDIIYSVEMRLQDETNDPPCLTTPVTVNVTSGTALIDDAKKKISFSPEISVVDISTPPFNSEDDGELAAAHSRKKWGDGETSPKAPKGFRKLLLFGRKS